MDSEVTYHILGLDCSDLPRELMGTKTGVTWFPQQANCTKCRIEWDRRCEAGTAPAMHADEPVIELPRMKLKVLP